MKIETNKWYEYKYNLNKILTSKRLLFIFNEWWMKIVSYKLLEGHSMRCLFKIKLGDGSFRTIGFAQTVNKLSRLDLIEIFIVAWEITDPNYHTQEIEQIIFMYKYLELGEKPEEKIIREDKKKESDLIHYVGGYNLPRTMDFTKWGIYEINNNFKNAIVYKPNSSAEYHININNNDQEVNLKVRGKTILNFKDVMLEHEHLDTFIRIIGKHEYHFKEGEINFKKIIRSTKFLNKVNLSSYSTNKFITMDLETRLIEGRMHPYCVCIYDGVDIKSFYLSDFKGTDEMLEEAIKFLMRRKYNQYKVYCHNFSNFDSVFLIRVLSNLSEDVKLIIRDGRIINLKFTYKKYTIFFRDSYLLLPSSLRSLATNFKVELKGIFPYKFVNKTEIRLDYEGKVPLITDFSEISDEEYEKYQKYYNNKSWNLREETIKYCEQDVRTLYQVIEIFKKKIFILFRIDPVKYSTLSSLAYAIYRSNFLSKEMNIPLINGNQFTYLKTSYTGGSVDVYKPYGKGIYRYDVNSLYPYVMKTFPMPTGNPIYFEGDILKKDSNAFGFFEVEITSPTNINIPLLQLRFKTDSGIKTIAPIGTWKGLYFSEELYNAQKYGYKFKVIRGYLFEQKYIFSEYVESLYQLKVNSKKGTPDYLISKLLLNSLYGRLGMNPIMEKHLIVNCENESDYFNNHKIRNIIDLKNGKEIISYIEDLSDFDFIPSLNISVVISAAVTAYARIYMSQFKTNPNINIYYTDTDSIDIDRPLEDKYIGTEIGKMKLEHIFEEAIFLAPKSYGGKTTEYEYVRIKGVKIPVEFKKLKSLLYKNKKLELHQEKWKKDFSEGTIFVRDEIYSLIATDSKRELIFDDNERFIGTKPLQIQNNMIK